MQIVKRIIKNFEEPSVENYKKETQGYPKSPVYVFVGDASCRNPSLYSIKGEYANFYNNGVLNTVLNANAAVAKNLGIEGYPTLILPCPDFLFISSLDKCTERAIADLYRAAGAGYSLIIPKDLGIKSKIMAKYYQDELDRLELYIKKQENNEADDEPINPIFVQAFKNGQEIVQGIATEGKEWCTKPEIDWTTRKTRELKDLQVGAGIALVVVVISITISLFALYLFVLGMMAAIPAAVAVLAGVGAVMGFLGGIVALSVAGILGNEGRILSEELSAQAANKSTPSVIEHSIFSQTDSSPAGQDAAISLKSDYSIYNDVAGIGA